MDTQVADPAPARFRTFARRHGGTTAAVTAVVAFAIGSAGAYRTLHHTPPAPIILRQAITSDNALSMDQTPGAGSLLVLLRNDGTTPVEVIDAAFSRSTAVPPLYVAPSLVAPGAEVNVAVAIPDDCQSSVGLAAPGSGKPVRILVHAHRLGTPVQDVPVELSGQLADLMQYCFPHG